MKRILLGCLSLFMLATHSQASLLVTPTRAELDSSRQKSAIFSLVNKGNVTSRFNIYFQDKQQLPSGDYVSLEGKGKLSQFVRYSPRRITLEPEEGTRVRLALRLPRGTAQGEYRSYLVFSQIPLTEALDSAATENAKDLSLSISAMLRISVPVVLRVGELDSEVFIEKGDLTQGNGNVAVTLKRTGDRSSYGDIEVLRESNGEKQTVGSFKNAALYTEIEQRTFNVSLDQMIEPSDRLWVRYSENEHLPNPKVVEYALR
ncbi:hypothetical protein FLM48_11700 [Shewanella sp. Scap07]|uniref:fimbrial biogenesis chaperone n=1 Tax=Shewanella sp. Scap07 TaxID=2589987 RepID=UPI0015B8E560|nr:hypothetical protein [Shewanella sp. Scap07]QLE85673.1 hypothetical protein FLM48_11700 [Shewanella sp. Scap07]